MLHAPYAQSLRASLSSASNSSNHGHLLRLGLFTLLLSALAACSDDCTDIQTTNSIAKANARLTFSGYAKSITLGVDPNPHTLSISGINGETGATVIGTGALSCDSTDTRIATVNPSTCVPTGIAPGTAIIRGSFSGSAHYNPIPAGGQGSASYALTVYAFANKLTPTLTLPHTTLTLNIYTDKLGVANAASIAGVSGQATPTGAITYSSSNTAVATIDNSGKITPASGAANNATATITATYTGDNNYQDATATTTVTISTEKYALVTKAEGGFYTKEECVKDLSTGLIWEGKPASGTRGSPALNTQGLYTNFDSWASGNLQKLNNWNFADATQADVQGPTNSIGYRNAVNAVSLCGFIGGWRLPTKDEIATLVQGRYDWLKPAPKNHLPSMGGATINQTWFPNISDEYFWTSSPFTKPGEEFLAYYDYFNSGIIHPNFSRDNLMRILLVR